MIHLDIFYHIFQHFAKLRNVHKFRHISRKVYNLINDDFLNKLVTSIIIERLNQFGISGNEFVGILSKNRMAISGSFPLQCILNEEWKNSDIDIYCKYDNPNKNLIYDFLHPWKFKMPV